MKPSPTLADVGDIAISKGRRSTEGRIDSAVAKMIG